MPQVQFIRGAPSRESQIANILGESLGEGLGGAIGDFFANKTLQNIMDDPSLKDAPLSERYKALESGMAKHGDRGQRFTQRRMQAEAQQEQERITKEGKDKAQLESVAVGKLLRGEQLTEEEDKSISPQNRIAIDKAITAAKPKPSEFQVNRARKQGEEFEKNNIKIGEMEDSIANLDTLEKQIQEVSGFGGTFKGLVGGQTAADFNASGFAATKPVIEIFNPTGMIPQSKIEAIRKEFAPTALDNRFRQRGKIDALRRLANQGLQRLQTRQQMIVADQQQPGSISQAQFDQHDRDTASLLDASAEEQRAQTDVQRADQNTNQIRSQAAKTLSGYVSAANGRPIRDLTPEEAEDLQRRGLIKKAKPLTLEQLNQLS